MRKEARKLARPEDLEEPKPNPEGPQAADQAPQGAADGAPTDSKPGSADGGGRKSFEVISPIRMNKQAHAIGERIELTRDEHKVLKAAGAIAGDW
jgi:hypothetical protein